MVTAMRFDHGFQKLRTDLDQQIWRYHDKLTVHDEYSTENFMLEDDVLCQLVD
jgi:hypothetical protein